MVLLRSKWSLRPTRWRRGGRPGVVDGPDATRRQPAKFGLPSTTPALLFLAPDAPRPARPRDEPAAESDVGTYQMV